MSTHQVIPPGSVLGVLGSGQLGRMFAIAARRLGYSVHVYSPDNDTPAGQIADVEVRGQYHDLERVADFARSVSVVTFEFENVPAATAETAARFAPVRPSGQVLHTTQNRLREKTALQQAGLPVTPFFAVPSEEGLHRAVDSLKLPAVLKTADWGYDGKGQRMLRTPADVATAWASLFGNSASTSVGHKDTSREKESTEIRNVMGREIRTAPAVLEAYVDFDCEISVVAARGLDGSYVDYGPIGNSHHKHILDISVCPAVVSSEVAKEALAIARTVLETLEVVGVLCVEFFVTRDGKLLINELAPRPHNSGHLTIDAHASCQFEQQVRAICGLPLGSTALLRPAAMANLLGDVWDQGEPNWEAALADPDVKLHLYGKREPRPGRKMGHLTVRGATVGEAELRARGARQALMRIRNR